MMMFISEISTSLLFIVSFFFTVMIVGRGVVSNVFEIGYFTMVIALLTNFFTTVKDFTYFVVNQTWYIRILEAYYDILAIEDEKKKEKSEDANYICITILIPSLALLLCILVKQSMGILMLCFDFSRPYYNLTLTIMFTSLLIRFIKMSRMSLFYWQPYIAEYP